jgi:hypothetical protein
MLKKRQQSMLLITQKGKADCVEWKCATHLISTYIQDRQVLVMQLLLFCSRHHLYRQVY